MSNEENTTNEKSTQNIIEESCDKVDNNISTQVVNGKTYTITNYIPKKRRGLFLGCYLLIKRIFDFFSSFFVGLLIIIPVLFLAFIVICKDFGNPFYKQRRMGKKGKRLKVWKIRSMVKKADNLEDMLTPEELEEYRREQKLDDDPRLLGYKKKGDGKNRKCLGAKIRAMSLDELPQIIFNICILGNMSVVGPRPVLEEELDTHYTPEQKKLLLTAKPGLTGYWQAYARNDATYASGERQKMELYYIEHCSLWLDIKIIFKTVLSVLKHKGAK